MIILDIEQDVEIECPHCKHKWIERVYIDYEPEPYYNEGYA